MALMTDGAAERGAMWWLCRGRERPVYGVQPRRVSNAPDDWRYH
jgi:hypothetical protein